MRLSRPLPSSPRMTSPKQLKHVPSLELNSYKIDTTSLSEKAKQIQRLKASLESQISQYKASEIMFHEQIQKISSENNELRVKVKKLQTELNKIKLDESQSTTTKINISTKNQQNQIKLLKISVSSLQDEIKSLKEKLQLKNEEILELSEYKKMYDIEVENKNNIMNFYENKLAIFKRDKGVLISKYEQKISQLGSSLEINKATMLQVQQEKTQSNNMNSTINNMTSNSNYLASNMPNGINKNNSIVFNDTHEKILTRDSKNQNEHQSTQFTKIKFIRSSKTSINLKQSKSEQNEKFETSQQFTPYRILKALNTNEPRNKENTPFSNKSIKNQLDQVSVPLLATGQDDILPIFDQNTNLSFKKSPYNLLATAKTLRNDDIFLQLIKKISLNLRNQKINSEKLKNFGSVRTLISVVSPSPTQVIEFLENFPLGPTDQCIQRMRRHLQKRYSSWSGSLLVELLIDKIEDVEIAFEVNQEEDYIVAGLTSDEENN